MIATGGCALASLQAGEDPVGSATPFDALILLQVPPPWPRIALQDGRLPDGVREALADAARRGRRAYVLLIDGGAPLPAGDGLRVLAWTRRPGAPAFAGAAAIVPRARAGDAVAAGVAGEALPGAGEAVYERELLVCTHGERDGCCGRFGEAAYRELGTHPAGHGGTRAWRVSHFGGHRFAPTLLDLPDGRMWGRLSPPALDALLNRDGSPAELRACYRGWCALSTWQQAAERDALELHGWGWRTAEVTSVARGERLELTARWPDGRTWTGMARVTRDAAATPPVPASCGAEPQPRVQMRVEWEAREPVEAPA